MDDLFKRTLLDVALYGKHIVMIRDKAVELGLSSDDVNVPRCFAKVDAALRDYLEDKAIAQGLGYKSVKVALKALSQMKEQPAYDLTKLPELFHNLPAIWLSGKPKTKLDNGFSPMRLRDAQRKHRVIVPLLLEAWELINGDEKEQEEVEKAYRSSSADEFEKDLYRYIYDLEEPTLEEQFEERAAVQLAEYEDWKKKNAEARNKRKD